jgi:hypothetical protein
MDPWGIHFLHMATVICSTKNRLGSENSSFRKGQIQTRPQDQHLLGTGRAGCRQCLLSMAERCNDGSINAAEHNGGDSVMITVPERVFYLESSEKACAMALFPCICSTVSHLPVYFVLLNAHRPLRPIATFGIVDDSRNSFL